MSDDRIIIKKFILEVFGYHEKYENDVENIVEELKNNGFISVKSNLNYLNKEGNHLEIERVEIDLNVNFENINLSQDRKFFLEENLIKKITEEIIKSINENNYNENIKIINSKDVDLKNIQNFIEKGYLENYDIVFKKNTINNLNEIYENLLKYKPFELISFWSKNYDNKWAIQRFKDNFSIENIEKTAKIINEFINNNDEKIKSTKNKVLSFDRERFGKIFVSRVIEDNISIPLKFQKNIYNTESFSKEFVPQVKKISDQESLDLSLKKYKLEDQITNNFNLSNYNPSESIDNQKINNEIDLTNSHKLEEINFIQLKKIILSYINDEIDSSELSRIMPLYVKNKINNVIGILRYVIRNNFTEINQENNKIVAKINYLKDFFDIKEDLYYAEENNLVMQNEECEANQNLQNNESKNNNNDKIDEAVSIRFVLIGHYNQIFSSQEIKKVLEKISKSNDASLKKEKVKNLTILISSINTRSKLSINFLKDFANILGVSLDMYEIMRNLEILTNFFNNDEIGEYYLHFVCNNLENYSLKNFFDEKVDEIYSNISLKEKITDSFSKKETFITPNISEINEILVLFKNKFAKNCIDQSLSLHKKNENNNISNLNPFLSLITSNISDKSNIIVKARTEYLKNRKKCIQQILNLNWKRVGSSSIVFLGIEIIKDIFDNILETHTERLKKIFQEEVEKNISETKKNQNTIILEILKKALTIKEIDNFILERNDNIISSFVKNYDYSCFLENIYSNINCNSTENLKSSKDTSLRIWEILETEKGAFSIGNQEQDKRESISMQLSSCVGIFFWPFLEKLFEKLGIMEDQRFVSEISRQKGVHVITFLYSEALYNFEMDGLFGKIICGMDFKEFLPAKYPLKSGVLPFWLCGNSTTWEENYRNQNEISEEERNIYDEIINIKEIVADWQREVISEWPSLDKLEFSDNEDIFTQKWRYLAERDFTITSIPSQNTTQWHIKIPVLHQDSEALIPPWLANDVSIKLPWLGRELGFFWI